MEEIFKTYLSVFLLLMTIIVGTTFLSAAIEGRNASAAMTNYISAIENSNASPTVIQHCVDDANDRFGKTKTDENALNVSNIIKQDDYLYGSITLTYKYQMPILGIDEEKTIISDIN